MPKKTVAAHDQAETSEFVEHFPEHAERTESPEFEASRHHLVRDLGLGCAVCLLQRLDELVTAGKLPAVPGTTLPTGVAVHPLAWYLREAGRLGLYPVPEKPLESHHFTAEWAHANQVDWAKANLYARMCDWYGLYAEGLTQGRPPICTPDDDRTQLILCAEHHRGEGLGIHHVPLPAWGAMLVARDGEVVLEPPGGHHEVLPKERFGSHVLKGA